MYLCLEMYNFGFLGSFPLMQILCGYVCTKGHLCNYLFHLEALCTLYAPQHIPAQVLIMFFDELMTTILMVMKRK